MDKERILSKFDEVDSYLNELEEIKPSEYEEYSNLIEKKRACERLLQIAIEGVIDVCNLLVSGLSLGLPSDEEDVFKKLESKKVISKNVKNILSGMKGMRNILVHKYGTVNDELVFEAVSEKLGDFDKFKNEILSIFKTKNSQVKKLIN